MDLSKTQSFVHNKELFAQSKQESGDDLGVCVLNVLLEVSPLVSLVIISLVKEEIEFYQTVT